MKEVEIFWYDLTPEKQQELLDAGFDNENVTDGLFSLCGIAIGEEEE